MSNVFILVDFSGDKVGKTTAELATVAARIGDVTAIILSALLLMLLMLPAI